jgi:hypothetical protein
MGNNWEIATSGGSGFTRVGFCRDRPYRHRCKNRIDNDIQICLAEEAIPCQDWAVGRDARVGSVNVRRPL